MAKYLVTGAAGFIGFHTTQRLLRDGHSVVGVDNLNSYYDVRLKESRLKLLDGQAGFSFVKLDIADREAVADLFEKNRFDTVIHLAAQAGVRYSLQNPFAYVDANVTGFTTILEGCRHTRVAHLVYASTSSVYGSHTDMPFSTHRGVDHPISFYAATKKANELMAHTYSHLFGLPCTGLRFFTVYGPWGRPDMALFLFTKAILEGRAIDVFNHGKMKRDFTFVDDIVEGVVRVAAKPAQASDSWNSDIPDPAFSRAPYRIFNIGNSEPVELSRFIAAIESALGMTAIKNMLPMQAGDVPATFADVADLEAFVGFKPKTSIEDGVASFVKWYRQYYCI